MDSHPLLQAPSQDTCAYFQRTSESASAPSSQCPTFPSERAAHYSRLFRFVNTSFRGPTPPLLPQTRRLSVEASRLLWQPFRCRQHPVSRKLPPLRGCRHRSGGRREARERILDMFVKCAITFCACGAGSALAPDSARSPPAPATCWRCGRGRGAAVSHMAIPPICVGGRDCGSAG